MAKAIKPPLGITPKWAWDKQRSENIVAAMLRYMDADMEIPIDWIKEHNELVKLRTK